MTLVFQEDGLKLFNDTFLASIGSTLVLRLFQNDTTPTIDSVLADFTEATFSNYAAQTFTPFVPSLYIRPRAVSKGTAPVFTKLGPTGNDIYGYYITDAGNTKLLWSERDPNAPIPMNVDGSTYGVIPQMTLRSEFGGAALLVADNFADPNGTNLTAHSIAPVNVPSTSWTAVNGSIQIQADKAQDISGLLTQYTLDCGLDDYQIEATVRPASGTDPGLLVRWNSLNHGYLLNLNTAAGFAQMYLANGSYSQLCTSEFAVTAGTDYDCVMSVQGSLVRAYINGAEVMATTVSDFPTGGNCGLFKGGAGGAGSTWANLKVRGIA